MREFNTSGPCNPALHYTVMRESLIIEGITKVKKGRYFTLFAPRQAGKTTFFQLMIEKLKESYTPLWITFENLATVNQSEFYQDLDEQIREGLLKYDFQTDYSITSPRSLAAFFKTSHFPIKPIVLVIDEFEGIPNSVLSEVMHTFRRIYHQKNSYFLHSLILVGVSTIAELVVSSASPFNIAEELQLPYFTESEVRALIKQYVTESGQNFEETVVKHIYENTHGQPGLVCALCAYLVEHTAIDQSITIEHYWQAQQHFLTQRFDKNIINIVQKAREKRAFMLKLLFNDEPLPFSIHDPDMAWLYANGVIDKGNGNTDILVPLYKKALITAFRPLINGETRYYINSPNDTLNQYLTKQGALNLNTLLQAYQAYVRRRGFRAFDTENLQEAAWHYSLDGFINFFILRLGGQTYLEVPSGRGRIDILIRYQAYSYVIETKIYSDESYFKKGKGQLVEYLKSEKLEEGYYVVFSHQHSDQDKCFTEEIIQGKRIYTHLILLKFQQPSRIPILDELKLTESEKVAVNLLKMGKLTLTQIAQATDINTARLEQLNDELEIQNPS